jgi:hypothetical protein
MVAVSVLVSGLDAELVRLGYEDSTMVWYRGCWRRLQKYFAARRRRVPPAGPVLLMRAFRSVGWRTASIASSGDTSSATWRS